MRPREDGSPSVTLDFQAVGRVVEKVREFDATLGEDLMLPETRSAEDWERVRLARADLSISISWAFTLRDVYDDWTSDSRSRRRYEAMSRVLRLSRDLVGLIEDDQLPLGTSLSPYFPSYDEHGFAGVDFSQLMIGLVRLQEGCKQERSRLKEMGLHDKAVLSRVEDEPVTLSTPGSAFITRMGHAFEETFKEAPSIKFAPDREPTGAFVLFVQAVTIEMGNPMSPDGIRKAWERANVSGQR